MIQPSSYITDLLVPLEPQIFGRGPDGHSKVESEDQTFVVGACWLWQDLSVEIRPARSADSSSLLMKPLSTDCSDSQFSEQNTAAQEEKTHLPHQVIRPGMSWIRLIQLILLLFRGNSAKCACIDCHSPGHGRCTHLKTGKTTCEQRWGRRFRSQLPAQSWDSFSRSLTHILASIHAIRLTRVTRRDGGSAAQVGHITPWLT